MYTLYSIPGTCSTGITALLKKLKIDFTIVKREEVSNYSDIVPTNQVPALKVDDKIITEGAAIVIYLLERHNNDMLPLNLSKKSEFLQWLMFNYATLHPAYSRLLTVSKIMKDGEEKLDLTKQLSNKISDLWKIIDNRLANQKFIVGDTPTIIDYLATIYTSWIGFFPPETEIILGDNIKRLVSDISSLPEFKAAYDIEGIEFKSA